MKILAGKPVPLPTNDEAVACLLIGNLFKPSQPDAGILKGVVIMGKHISDNVEKSALAGAVAARSIGKKDEKKQPSQPSPLGGFGKPADGKK